MVNSTASNSVSDQVIKSEMPLRIALLVLPTPLDLSLYNAENAKLLPHLLPELYRSKLLETTELVSIKVDDFEANLTATIESIEQGKIVQISTETSSLLMMPALTAAQNRIHPHAVLAAMQIQTEAGLVTSALTDTCIADSCVVDSCMKSALNQAKRKQENVSKRIDLPELSSTEQFDAVCEQIKDLASRTHHRDATSISPKQATSHYWFTDHHQARVLAINLTNASQSSSKTQPAASCISFVVSQGSGFIAAKSIINEQRLQFVVCADNQAELVAELDALQAKLTALASKPRLRDSLLTLMRDNLLAFEASTNRTYAITLQASSIKAMQQELDAIALALPKMMDEKSQYRTPAGSYFTAEPLGTTDQSGLAFVYPGVGTVYSDMFSELHGYFPSLYSQLEREGDLKSMFQAEAIYNLDPKVTPAMPLGDLAIAGVGSSYLLTQLLVKEFGITPNFALGYSMGEASMWASLGVWKDPHALIEKTKTDPLFTRAISGKLTAVRRAWQLNEADAEIVWNSFVVRSAAAPIKALLPKFPHAYLAIVQGDTCVIAGCETQCRELLTQLGKRGIAANRVTAMHTTPAMEEHSNVAQFYQQPLEASLPTEIKFISAASGDSKVTNSHGGLDSQTIANSIADTFCNTLDFTALIHSAQKQGAKLFVELGADRQNCTLIDKIAKQDRQCGAQSTDYLCCTVPVNAKGGDDITTLLKALGQLISHRVPLTTQPLIDGLNREIAQSQLQAVSTAQGVTAEQVTNLTLQGEV
ncbi:PfaB family protein [Shewanella schlegeliana]|uniref:PfaB family protein n=1 Tax=Shewanella schlegeliana TaxID=190308 RepID=A0ABS1SY62_9GAMM|nr:PfaB family protein [Shewanella schlegeliana]MBL4913462.1 PfaB family protein [Shewanella schlegeliana]MCL1108353.1 PfaB family protein [Shewanella schlegeliana]GIU37407.1 omega-3 polyunsaturated fatty acid synthase PfaB [Shewanella schlegeliana]